MPITTVLQRSSLTVVDYRCTAQPGERGVVERHGAYSVAYVQSGSFGYRSGGRSYELVAGSLLVGRPGGEYICSHHPAPGDRCLSFPLRPPPRRAARAARGPPPPPPPLPAPPPRARHAGLSEFHFLRLFTRVLGVTPK